MKPGPGGQFSAGNLVQLESLIAEMEDPFSTDYSSCLGFKSKIETHAWRRIEGCGRAFSWDLRCYGNGFQNELVRFMKAAVLHTALSLALLDLDSEFSATCPASMKGCRGKSKSRPVQVLPTTCGHNPARQDSSRSGSRAGRAGVRRVSNLTALSRGLSVIWAAVPGARMSRMPNPKPTRRVRSLCPPSPLLS